MMKIYTLKNYLPIFILILGLNISINAQVETDNLTVSGHWQVPCGVTEITVEAWGAGGAGGVASDAGRNGGGGGGAYAKKTIAVNVGDSYEYSIGARGVSTGSINGGDTWFSSPTTVKAQGGRGVPPNTRQGATGGLASASVGDTRYNGGNGGSGSTSNNGHSGGGGGAALVNGIGGNGGTSDGGSSVSPGGNGGRGARSNDGWFGAGYGPGHSGNNYGGGGGGARALLGILTQNGGNGAPGFIRITYPTPNTGTPPPITTIQTISTNPSTGIGCENNEVTLQASGGNTGAGVSTLWYNTTTSPSFAYINEFMGTTYSLTNATMGTVTNGNRTFYSTTNDPMINMPNILPSGLDPATHKYIVIRYRVVAGTGGDVQIYFHKGATGAIGERVKTHPITSDGQWHIMNIDMTHPDWDTSDGNVTGWRFDFASNPGVQMEIDYILLSNMTFLENTNADDSILHTTVNTPTANFRAIRIGDQAAACGNTIPYTAPTQISIVRSDKSFTGTVNNNWDNASNWTANGVPNSSNCVFVEAGRNLVVNTNAAAARSIRVASTGSIRIPSNNSLTVTHSIVNLGDGENFVVENNANLIQIDNTAVNTGSIKVEKQFTFVNGTNPANDRKQYNFVISPVVGQNIKTIYPVNPNVIEYRESNNLFYNHNGSYTAGKGYGIKEPSKSAVSGTTVTANFRGVPFNGELIYPLARTNPGNENYGFNLIGNPYPSNLDIKALYDDNSTVIEPTFFFWDNRGNTQFTQQGSDYGGSNYAIFNAVSGTGNGTGSAAEGAPDNSRVPNRYVKVGTGFMVQAISSGQSISFNNTYRSADNSGPAFFGKNADTSLFAAEYVVNSETQNEKDRYWLTLTTMSGLEFMNAVVYFDEGNNDYAKDDSDAMGASDEIFTLVGQQYLAINGRAPFVNTDVVPLGVRHFADGKFIIDIHTKEGVFANGQKIYLKDNYLNKLHELSMGYYEYESEAGEFINRFEILYKNPGVTDPVLTASNTNHLKISKENHQIVIDSSIDKITAVEIFNLGGWSIYKKDNVNSQEHKVAAQSLGKGIIIVNVITEKAEVVSRKFINN